MTDKLNVTAPILDDSNANNSTTFVNPNGINLNKLILYNVFSY